MNSPVPKIPRISILWMVISFIMMIMSINACGGPRWIHPGVGPRSGCEICVISTYKAERAKKSGTISGWTTFSLDIQWINGKRYQGNSVKILPGKNVIELTYRGSYASWRSGLLYKTEEKSLYALPLIVNCEPGLFYDLDVEFTSDEKGQRSWKPIISNVSRDAWSSRAEEDIKERRMQNEKYLNFNVLNVPISSRKIDATLSSIDIFLAKPEESLGTLYQADERTLERWASSLKNVLERASIFLPNSSNKVAISVKIIEYNPPGSHCFEGGCASSVTARYEVIDKSNSKILFSEIIELKGERKFFVYEQINSVVQKNILSFLQKLDDSNLPLTMRP